MQFLQAVLHWEGYGLCHQLPQRSFFGGGVQVPVCARDTGIYLGVLISIALVAALHRGSRPTGFPTRAGWSLMAVMVGAMALDGVTEYAGLRTTTNELRLITGLMAGFAIGAALVPMLNDEIWRLASPERVLSKPWQLAAWFSAVPISYAIVYWAFPLLGLAYPIIVALAIVATLTAVNLVVVSMLPAFERKADRLSDAWLAIVVAVGIALAEIWLAAALRAWLVAATLRLGG